MEPPIFEIGQKVRSLQNVRNDGTYPGPAVGDVLIPEGAIGYVISIGSYLQMYHIYSVDFFEQRRVIGMRGKELEMVDAHANAPKEPLPHSASRSAVMTDQKTARHSERLQKSSLPDRGRPEASSPRVSRNTSGASRSGR